MKDAPARLLAEFLGVFILCLATLGAVTNGAELTGIALAPSFAVFVAICAFAHISGAHFNPAVTIALAATRRIAPVDAVAYIVVQLLGAVAAAALTKSVFGGFRGAVALGPGVSTGTGILVEVVATFILMIVIMGVAVDPRGTSPVAAGLPIGLAIAGNIFWAGPATGAAMNPARWFGPALVNGSLSATPIVWIVGPIAGALIAVAAYELVMKPVRD